MRKLKFSTKQNLAKPISVDEVRLISVRVNLREGHLEAVVAMLDSDGGENGAETLVEERPIHIGLAGMTGLDLGKLEKDVLKIIQGCGVIPTDSTLEE
jgi:hypothetical protein